MEEFYLQKYNDVYPCESKPAFWRNMSPPSSGLKSTQQGVFLPNVYSINIGEMGHMTKEHMKKHQRPGRTDNQPWKLNTLWEHNGFIKCPIAQAELSENPYKLS
jgi:hypothetical protein